MTNKTHAIYCRYHTSLEGWQSGLMQQSWKLPCRKVPRVRISVPPPCEFKNLERGIFYNQKKEEQRWVLKITITSLKKYFPNCGEVFFCIQREKKIPFGIFLRNSNKVWSSSLHNNINTCIVCWSGESSSKSSEFSTIISSEWLFHHCKKWE